MLGIVATFVLPPPFLERSWLYFTRFIVAIIVGLFVILSAKWDGKAHTFHWVISVIVMLLGTVAGYFAYDAVLHQWTIPYASTRVVIGKTYTDSAKRFREQFRNNNGYYPDDENLVWKNAGPNGLWSKTEVESRRLGATALYISTVVLAVCSIFSVLQAIACSRASTSSRSP